MPGPGIRLDLAGCDLDGNLVFAIDRVEMREAVLVEKPTDDDSEEP